MTKVNNKQVLDAVELINTASEYTWFATCRLDRGCDIRIMEIGDFGRDGGPVFSLEYKSILTTDGSEEYCGVTVFFPYWKSSELNCVNMPLLYDKTREGLIVQLSAEVERQLNANEQYRKEAYIFDKSRYCPEWDVDMAGFKDELSPIDEELTQWLKDN